MRLLEWGLLILALVLIFAPKPRRMRSIRIWMSGISSILFLHLLFGTVRWQLAPLYAVLLAAIGVPILSPSLSAFVKQIDRSIAVFLLALTVLLTILFPLITLPPLAGTYDVGTLTMTLTDPQRSEPFAQSAELSRHLRMQVWYPANVTVEPLAPYSDDIAIGGGRWMRRLGLPPFLTNHVRGLDSRSFTKPPVLIDDAPYPLLLFVGGIGGQRTQSSLLFEQLASEGYIVAAADHPFYSGYTLYPNGDLATYRPAMFDVKTSRGQQNLMLMAQVLADDMTLMLNTLADLSARPFTYFTSRINIDQIGVFGHSTGAAAAADFCRRDLRCKAYLGLDPWLMPASEQLVSDGLSQPIMIIRGQEAISELNKPRLLRLAHNSHDRNYEAVLQSAKHLDFTDYRHFSPLLRWAGLVSRNDERNAEIIVTYAQAFFDHELRGWGGALLFVDSAEFPEATITSRR